MNDHYNNRSYGWFNRPPRVDGKSWSLGQWVPSVVIAVLFVVAMINIKGCSEERAWFKKTFASQSDF